MPIGANPPTPALPESVFDALAAMTWDANQRAFVDGQNHAYFLFVDTDGNGNPRWFHATNADGGSNPRGEIPSGTADAIANGTWQSGGTIAYDGSNWKVRHERDGNGTHVANAVTV